MKKDKKINSDFSEGKISRKEAIKKVTALTAATLLFLETKAQADTSQTPGRPPGRGR